MSLAVAIVCKNNQTTIGRTLDSVRGLADEIVAVDSGSSDGTLDLLAAHGAHVTRTEWKGHIATKQMALDLCKSEWVLSLDSDESVESDLAGSIRAALERDEASLVGYELNRKVWYFDRFLDYAWQPEWRLRLVRNGRARWGGVNPHDKLDLIGQGRTARLAGTLRHDSFVDMAHHLSAQVRHSEVSARSLLEAGRRPSRLRLVASPAGALFKQLVLKGAWRDGYRGWAAAGSTAAATLMKHILLIERGGRASEEAKSPGDDGPDPVRR